jgi:hypothetical protein
MRINENKKFCGIFYYLLMHKVQVQVEVRKKLGQDRDYFLKLMTIRFFIRKFLLRKLDYGVYLPFYQHKSVQIAHVLINKSTKQDIFGKFLNFIFFFLFSILLMTLFHQNYCFSIFDQHQTIDLVKKIC